MAEVDDARLGRDGVAPPEGHGIAAPERDLFLDAVRTVATVRVVLWHATGFAVVSYLVSAMPAMFFVAGSLFAASTRKRQPGAVVVDRVRRLLPPLWAFSAIVWSVTTLRAPAGRVDTAWWQWLLWFAPLWDPPGNSWEDGWLSSPLWFLRALLWLLLAAPLLIVVVRRRPRVAVAVAVAVVVGTDLARRSEAVFSVLPAPVWWSVGDFALYGIFFGAGIAHRDGVFSAPSKRLAAGALVCAAGAAVWAITQPVPRGVVNNAHPLHLLVGATWLLLALAARDQIAALASHRRVAPVVRLVSRRSMTIYVWHTTAIVVALWLLDSFTRPAVARSVLYGLSIAAGTLVAAAAFGWLEDLGARRPRVLWPLTRSTARWNAAPGGHVAIAMGLVGLFVVTSSAPATRVTESAASPRRPPTPSQQPPPPVFTAPPVTSVALPPVAAAEMADRMTAMAEDWRLRSGIDAVNIGVRLGHGEAWVAVSGTRPDTGRPAAVDDSLDITSATKLFTTSLVLRAADRGMIDLDAPLPPLDAVPDFPYTGVLTPMMLLTHRSGLANYRDTPTYLEDPNRVDSASAAIEAAGHVPLTMVPGEREEYSSTNFLVLGLLLEQATKRSFDDLFAHGILDRLGLVGATILPSEPGEPRQATAGLSIPMDELLRATELVLTDNDGVSAAMHARRVSLDPDTAGGAGAYGYCPCTRDADGETSFFGIGYTGGHTWVAYVPSLDVTVGIDVYDDMWTGDRFGAMQELYEQLALLGSRVAPPAAER